MHSRRPGGCAHPEQATQVGGDLTVAGKKLAALQKAAATVLDAASNTGAELSAAFGRIGEAHGARDFGSNGWLGLAAVVFLLVLVFAFRRATARLRQQCIGDTLHARGAAGLLGFEAVDWALFAAGAYALIEFQFNTGGQQDLLVVAVLWALVRWRLFMMLIEVVLRPRTPAFRLIAMSDSAARQIMAILAVAILIGLAGISVMPVLLRAGLPIPAGQVIVLLQGVLVAAGCALALWRYRASHSAAARALSRPKRTWFGFGITAILVLWLSWTAAVLLLEFSIYHSLVWSLRIAAFAYVVDQLLGLSSEARWVLFLQRSITAAAILAIAILLAETWLVDEFVLVAPATWIAVRRSLITAGVTLFVGYVAWRYLHHWTEERLRASAPGLAPGRGPAAKKKARTRLRGSPRSCRCCASLPASPSWWLSCCSRCRSSVSKSRRCSPAPGCSVWRSASAPRRWCATSSRGFSSWPTTRSASANTSTPGA